MQEQPVLKKVRVWNPALDDEEDNIKSESQSSTSSPIQCMPLAACLPMPQAMFFQQYLQLSAPFIAARLQKQEARVPQLHPQHNIAVNLLQNLAGFTAAMSNARPSSSNNTSNNTHTTSQPSATIQNPIVQAALGNSAINENCCAVCGASFRLTGDLVQHMRNNHRRNKRRQTANN